MSKSLIRNSARLIETHGPAAKIVISALEAGINAAEPSTIIRRALSISDNQLLARDINGKVYSSELTGRIFVVGIGKAAYAMYTGVYSQLGKRIYQAAITIPLGLKARQKGPAQISYASHPIPGRQGLRATSRLIKTASLAKRGDLLIFMISGGGSALMPGLAPGVTLNDKKRITSILLSLGAEITELNVVRKHLSSVKGGQFLRHLASGVKVLTLIISDVIGDELQHVASGPTVPDPSTFQDALQILEKYHVPKEEGAYAHIRQGARGMFQETPKERDPIFDSVDNVLVGNNGVACQAAKMSLEQNNIRSAYIGSSYGGEAQVFGRYIAECGVPRMGDEEGAFAKVAGGETTVALGKRTSAKGGRNQEAALACALSLADDSKITAAFMGTDGIDGNSPAAGGLVSSATLRLAARKKMDLQELLTLHESYDALKRTRSVIRTGYTGTNVNDIAVVLYYPK